MKELIYLDNAATTFPKPETVYEVLDKFYRNCGVNAGRGSYKLARDASNIILDTRKILGDLINYKDYNRIIFTSSATQAANQIINGLKWDEFKTVYVSPFEHNAIMRPLNYIKRKFNINIKILPFNNETFELDIDKMKQMFAQNYPDYVFISHISNVTGYILPIEIIIEEAKKFQSTVVLDAAQSIGLISMDVKDLNADFIIFAGHKTLYGPFGIAGYIDNSNITLAESFIGGTGSDSLNLNMPNSYPDKYEAASHNIQAIAGLNAALGWIYNTGIQNIKTKEMNMTKKVIEGMKRIEGISLYAPLNIENQVGIISFNLEGYSPDELGQVLDEDFNIAVRTGYHCAPLIHDFLGTREKGGTVRISLGYFNEEEEIDSLLEGLENL